MTALIRHPVHRALTRPQMFAGVTYNYFIINGMVTTEIFLITGSWLALLAGGVMHGITKTKQKRDKRYKWEKYICSTYHKFGNEEKSPDGSDCHHNTVDQGELLDLLPRKLRLAILGGGKREVFMEAIRKRLEARQQIDPSEMEGLRKRLAELDEQRLLMSQRSVQGRDYLDWFEATQQQEKSGAFDAFFEASRELRVLRPERDDPVSNYLDAVSELVD